jgi:hypothetical protein
MRQVSLVGIAVFLAWFLMDFVIHGVILASSYAATPSLWRPMHEMKMTVMIFWNRYRSSTATPLESHGSGSGVGANTASVIVRRAAVSAL